MSQMHSNEYMYGRYEGNQHSERQSYNPEVPSGAYDDEFVDGLAQRISQRMGQGTPGKVFPVQQPRPASTLTAGHRLALAIVSVAILVPLAAILVGGVGGGYGLLAFGAACFTIFIINIAFNARGSTG